MASRNQEELPRELARGRERLAAWRRARTGWWPKSSEAACKRLAAHQLAVLFSARDAEHIRAAPDWRPRPYSAELITPQTNTEEAKLN